MIRKPPVLRSSNMNFNDPAATPVFIREARYIW